MSYEEVALAAQKAVLLEALEHFKKELANINKQLTTIKEKTQ